MKRLLRRRRPLVVRGPSVRWDCAAETYLLGLWPYGLCVREAGHDGQHRDRHAQRWEA